jgi:NADPH2:quinone reductase
MKAIRVNQLGGPEVLSLEEVTDPKPSEGQVLIRVESIGVNPVDTYIRAGTYPILPSLPYIPGSDAAGIVIAVGEGIGDLAVGARVYVGGTVSGVYAEMAVCRRDQVRLLPVNLSFDEGAAIHVPYATAYRALFQIGDAKAGERVLVHGATGGVGLACLQWARSAGLVVIGTAGTDAGLRVILDQGGRQALNHTMAGHLDQVIPLTDGKGVDLVVEMLANANLGHDLKVLARRGRVMVVGSRGDVSINPRDLISREATIRGVQLGQASPEEMKEIDLKIAEALSKGTLKPRIAARFPLSQAAEAHRQILRAGSMGKIVLQP